MHHDLDEAGTGIGKFRRILDEDIVFPDFGALKEMA